jgi:integrase
MNAQKVASKRSGRSGWRWQFTDPATRRRTHKTVWIGERREAEKAFRLFLDSREARRIGLPDHSGWEMPYSKLAEKFVNEAPLASDARRTDLQRWLTRNHLNLQVGSDLSDLGKLTAGCRKLLEKQSDDYVIRCLQLPLKQLSRWAASIGLLPYDPLAAWKRMPWSGHKKRRRAFLPDEVRAIFSAADEIDSLLNRTNPSSIVFKTLLLTGNRPGALFAAKSGDLQGNRIHLPLGSGKKRNGMSTLPPAFVPELTRYVSPRKQDPKQPLLVSHRGCEIDRLNISDDFKFSMVLAFVRMAWPQNEIDALTVDPIQVAYLIYKGKHRGFDGAPPKDPAKLKARQKQIAEVELLTAKIAPEVERRLEGRDLYALRKTHVSWARQLVNPDSVKLQVGHAPQDVEERHYLDLVDARVSSEAVWDVLTGKRRLSGDREQAQNDDVALVAGVEIENLHPNLHHSEIRHEKTRTEARVFPLQHIDKTNVMKIGTEGFEPSTSCTPSKRASQAAPRPVCSSS